jgi:hypothetical protein
VALIDVGGSSSQQHVAAHAGGGGGAEASGPVWPLRAVDGGAEGVGVDARHALDDHRPRVGRRGPTQTAARLAELASPSA